VRVAKVALAVGLASSVIASGRAPVQFVSAAEFAALIEQAGEERRGDQPGISRPLLHVEPYSVNFEIHVVAGPAAVHRHAAELFYVVDGAGVLIVGGTLRNASAIDSENMRGTGIDGGIAQPIAKGDVLIVEEDTPHGFRSIQGKVVLMTLKLPHGGPQSK
jgi:mannose-6-phosphate isomerase-like protein (cupin superfamily)